MVQKVETGGPHQGPVMDRETLYARLAPCLCVVPYPRDVLRMPLLAKDARRNQALAEIDSLKSELDEWHARWTAADRHDDGSPRGQYQTQLGAVYSEVGGTAQILRSDLISLDVSGDAGDVYGKCALAERQIIWLWRVWYFFRDKFEQRDDRRFSDILSAADEVVWSCYRPFFQLPWLKQLRQPAPLPYVEPDFSPAVLRRDQKQVLDRKDRDFLLVRKAFSDLPVPILKIPITSINNPWALVLIGHEVGHVVEPLLEADFRDTFREALRSAIRRAGEKEDDQETWGGWADEIFADLYSILTMGQWAVWAMTQFETAEAAVMMERRFLYPSPLVRLALMTALARHYGLELDSPVADAAASDEVKRDLGYVGPVVDAITALPQILQLVGALPFSKSSYETKKLAGNAGEVEQWSQHLLGKSNSPVSGMLRSARMVVAGAAHAWSETVFAEGPNRPKDGGEGLRQNAIAKIKASAAPGVRSAVAPTAPKREPGRALFGVLARADDLLDESDALPR